MRTTIPRSSTTPVDAQPSTVGPSHGIRGGPRGWTARRPVAAFLFLVFAIGYPVMSLPILADRGVIPGGELLRAWGWDAGRLAGVLLTLVALLPAALWVTWAVDDRAGVRALVQRVFQWRIGAWWWLLVLAGIPTLTIAFTLLLGGTPRPVELVAVVASQGSGLLINLALVNLWEETAWAGVVQTRLQRRHGMAVAALLTAVPFALIHLPLQFIGDFTLGSLVAALTLLLIVCALVRLLIGVVLRGTQGSILAAALLHTAFNRSNNEEGLVATLVEGEARGAAALLAVVALTVGVAIVTRKDRR